MSDLGAIEPKCIDTDGTVDLIIVPRTRDLGGFSVRRVLPAADQPMVGPFIFFDHMGPADFPPGHGIQVRPHPHIGIATITYLFAGQIMHRDSLGYAQAIRPGAVNLMLAGRGIVHSERAGDDLDTTSRLHGIQSWIALPDGHEELDPSFTHYPGVDLPEVRQDGARVRIIIGEQFGQRSPVAAYSPTLYLEVLLDCDGTFDLPDDQPELAAYIVDGSVRADGDGHSSGTMLVAKPGRRLSLTAMEDSRLMVIGGAPPGERHIWWNFVSSSLDRIEQAKRDWKAGKFAPVPDDDEFIPLPE